MHANFSNTTLELGSKETYETICEAFRPVVNDHVAVYGAYNDQRLTGDHETQSITEFGTEFLIESFKNSVLLRKWIKVGSKIVDLHLMVIHTKLQQSL